MYCRKEMVKILKCFLIPKKSYGTLSKGAIFFGQPCIFSYQAILVTTDFKHIKMKLIILYGIRKHGTLQPFI